MVKARYILSGPCYAGWLPELFQKKTTGFETDVENWRIHGISGTSGNTRARVRPAEIAPLSNT
jgi:hypothetical protein